MIKASKTSKGKIDYCKFTFNIKFNGALRGDLEIYKNY